MSAMEKTYTYRCGQKLELEKSPDQMVTRALAEQLDSNNPNILTTEQVSTASIRVTTYKKNLEQAMMHSRPLAATHHAYFEVQTGCEFLISDRILVLFKEPPSHTQLDYFCAQYSLLKKAQYSETDFLFQLTFHTGMNPVKLVVLLTENDPNVAIVEHDLNQRMQTCQPLDLPQDPEYRKQWHLHTHHNHAEFNPESSTLCEPTWELLNHFGDQDVVVCIADDGCKLDHLDFNVPHKFADWGYFKGNTLIRRDETEADPAKMYQTGANHGTSCAGIIAGETDAVLTVGAAPNCRLLPIKWESSGDHLFINDSKLLTILNEVADKIDVMSNSWGRTPIYRASTQVVNKIKSLQTSGGRRGKGVVFLWAAGNENCLIHHTSTQQVPYSDGWRIKQTQWQGVKRTHEFINNLSQLDNVMHIGAISSTAQRSHYSNYGTGLTLCAPSSNSHQYLRMTVTGLPITTATGHDSGVTHGFGGTSSATPLVAGIAALVISANPELDALEVIAILNQTAAKNLNFTGYPQTPPTSFDPDTDWDVSPIAPFDQGEFIDDGNPHGTWSPWFGHGRVNAYAAVTEALQHKSQQLQNTTQLHFQQHASPNRLIPDHDEVGISDSINCDQALLLQTITITVDIQHPYIGDLVLTLISPTHTAIVLHSRTGRSTDNLQRRYTTNNTPTLHQLHNEPCLGYWTLQVQDLAPQDTGRFKHWSLELTGSADKTININDHAGIRIPDNDPSGIERTLVIHDSGHIAELAVTLDISHSYISDLQVSLTSPKGTTVVLHNRSGENAHNIVAHYTITNTPALSDFSGQSMTGDWHLNIIDQANHDVGKLNSWGLRVVSE